MVSWGNVIGASGGSAGQDFVSPSTNMSLLPTSSAVGVAWPRNMSAGAIQNPAAQQTSSASMG